MMYTMLTFSDAKLVVGKLFFCKISIGFRGGSDILHANKSPRGYIIDHLNMGFSAHNETVIIYYFFNSSEKKSLKASAFVRCILHQVIRLESLLPDYERRLESLFRDRICNSEPATSELEELFLYFFQKFKGSFLLIDGLDETSEVEQRNVKHFLKKVQNISSARVLAITHAAMDMSKIFTYGLTLQIKPKNLEQDIATFIQSQIDKHSQEELCDCSPRVLDLIKHKLVSDAEGM